MQLVPGMSGGRKNMFLRLNRAEVMAYYEANGEAATRERYNIKKQVTWDHLMNPKARRPNTKLSKADRALLRAEIAEQASRDAKREVQGLKDMYNQFIPHLANQLSEKFFIPLIAGKIELPAELEYKAKPDPLSLTDFEGKSAK